MYTYNVCQFGSGSLGPWVPGSPGPRVPGPGSLGPLNIAFPAMQLVIIEFVSSDYWWLSIGMNRQLSVAGIHFNKCYSVH